GPPRGGVHHKAQKKLKSTTRPPLLARKCARAPKLCRAMLGIECAAVAPSPSLSIWAFRLQLSLTTPETSNVDFNTRQNNKIVWRNVNIVSLDGDELPQRETETFILRNPALTLPRSRSQSSRLAASLRNPSLDSP